MGHWQWAAVNLDDVMRWSPRPVAGDGLRTAAYRVGISWIRTSETYGMTTVRLLGVHRCGETSVAVSIGPPGVRSHGERSARRPVASPPEDAMTATLTATPTAATVTARATGRRAVPGSGTVAGLAARLR